MTTDNLKGAIRQPRWPRSPDRDRRLASYQALGREFAGHGVIEHHRGEYARGATHTQTVES